MSLKYFHFIFVTAAWLLCFVMAAWAFFEPSNEGSLGVFLFGIGSTVLGLVLIGYEFIAWRKLRKIYIG